MIQFSGEAKDGGKLVGIGLSRENCNRLLEGKPIALDLRPHGVEGTLLILGGETEKTIEAEIMASGVYVGKPS